MNEFVRCKNWLIHSTETPSEFTPSLNYETQIAAIIKGWKSYGLHWYCPECTKEVHIRRKLWEIGFRYMTQDQVKDSQSNLIIHIDIGGIKVYHKQLLLFEGYPDNLEESINQFRQEIYNE